MKKKRAHDAADDDGRGSNKKHTQKENSMSYRKIRAIHATTMSFTHTTAFGVAYRVRYYCTISNRDVV